MYACHPFLVKIKGSREWTGAFTTAKDFLLIDGVPHLCLCIKNGDVSIPIRYIVLLD
jgi:hypothetical protein